MASNWGSSLVILLLLNHCAIFSIFCQLDILSSKLQTFLHHSVTLKPPEIPFAPQSLKRLNECTLSKKSPCWSTSKGKRNLFEMVTNSPLLQLMLAYNNKYFIIIFNTIQNYFRILHNVQRNNTTEVCVMKM